MTKTQFNNSTGKTLESVYVVDKIMNMNMTESSLAITNVWRTHPVSEKALDPFW